MIWNDDDIKVLKECVQNGVKWKQIAKILGRGEMAVRTKAYVLKIVPPKYKGNSERRYQSSTLTDMREIQKCLNCTKSECDNCLGNLKI